jgi:DNA-binding NtrC family response regulator
MKRRVCIIDDDDDVREVITFALEEDGFEVFPFDNAEDALDTFTETEKPPGFFLLDYLMPKMDGASFIRKIREDHPETLGKVPCALSSANGKIDEDLPSDVLELKKPMDLDQLLDLVRDNCL